MYSYLEKIKNLSFDNKYTKWYCAIVKRALDRYSFIGYAEGRKKWAKANLPQSECHHIVPRCLDQDSVKSLNNLVHLTLREHYVCHLLLSKMMLDKNDYYKMLFALTRISNKHGHGRNSKAYSFAKQKCLAANRQKGISQMQDPEMKERCIKPMIDAHKNIDHSSKEWLERSIHSKESQDRATATKKSDSFKNFSSQRELAKGKEFLAQRGKEMQQISVQKGIEKYGSLEAYKEARYSNSLCKRRLINLVTGRIEVVKCKKSQIPSGYKLPEQK